MVAWHLYKYIPQSGVHQSVPKPGSMDTVSEKRDAPGSGLIRQLAVSWEHEAVIQCNGPALKELWMNLRCFLVWPPGGDPGKPVLSSPVN